MIPACWPGSPKLRNREVNLNIDGEKTDYRRISDDGIKISRTFETGEEAALSPTALQITPTRSSMHPGTTT